MHPNKSDAPARHPRATFQCVFLLLVLAAAFSVFYTICAPEPYQGIWHGVVSTGSFQNGSASREEKMELTRILFWTKYYEGTPIKNESKIENGYEITVNRSQLASSSFVVFHGRDLTTSRSGPDYHNMFVDMPSQRFPHQLWVFFLMESPIHTFADLEGHGSVFNLTMTYRSDSDVYLPYGRLVPHGHTHQNVSTNATMVNIRERKLVAWLVSDCNPQSHRRFLVEQLQTYIKVDIYGGCGTLRCPKNGSCHEYLGRNYKFYLSFENSLCEDYVTEKFFYALEHGMVPVVYGGANYKDIAPPDSFINVSDYPNVKALVLHLLFLDENDDEYLKYFNWKQSFRVQNHYDYSTNEFDFGSALTAFWKYKRNETFVVKDLYNFWYRKGTELACHNPAL